ncbi:MAG: hypothetical protein QXR19_13515 [Candidatus Jordarchaeaceae archaeon]
MERKAKSVLVVVFFAALMIGTGIVAAQTYKTPSPDYLAPSIITILNQSQFPAYNLQGTKDESAQYTTSTSLLNLTQTSVTKESVQSQINEGFLAWMFEKPERLLSSFNADNETISTLFFQFLSQNPKYHELFKQYDKLLSEEIQVDMLRQAEETFKYVDLIMSEGEIVREWNTTNTVNDTTYTYVYRDYSLEINGTTQHLLKVSVYASDGTLIIDPYVKIANAPLIYWTWWFGWYPVLYGWEYGAYTHYTPAETPYFLAAAYAGLEGADDWTTILFYISAIVVVAGLLIGGEVASLVTSVTGLILAGMGLYISYVADKTWEDINYVNMINANHDPSFGFMLYQNFHWVANPQWWDPLSYTKFCLIQSNGVVYQVWPTTGVCYMSTEQVNVYVSFLVHYNNQVGFNQWVWVSN